MADTASELLKQSGFDSSSMDVNKSLEQQITNWSSAGTVPPEQNNPIDNPINLPVSSPIVSLPSFQPKQTKEDDVLSALKSLSANIESGSDYHPEDDMYTSKAALPGDFERYDQYTPGLDNEQLAFARQTGTERVAKSVANMANSFTKTLVESVTAPFVGVGYMLKGATEGEGVFNKAFYDNPYMKMLEKWQGFDLYESNQRKNAAWYSPDYWMTANSLNSLLSTVGDLAAFGVSGKFFYGPMMGAISKPIVGAIDKGYWKALNEIAEFNAVVPAGAEGKAAMGELSQAMKRITEAGMADPEKLNASTKLIRDISKRYMSQMNTWNRVQQGSLGVVNFLGSAQASALESSTSFRAKLIEKFQENKGRGPNEDEIQKIDEAANEVGATTGAAMTIMGAVTLHGMFKGILAKKDGQALIRNEIKALAEGAPKEVEILGAKTMVPQYTAQVEKEITSKAGKLFTPVKRAGKAIYNRLDPMTGIGFLEFGLVPTSVESYYEKKYTDGDASIIEDALIPNVKNMFTKEGATSFFTGLFAGSIMKAVQGRGIKDTRDADTEMALDAINQTYLKSYLKANIDAIKRGKILQKEYLSSIQDGNKEAELTLRQQMLENWLYPRIKYNSTSLVFKELEGYKKLAATEEGMKELQADGVVPEGDNIKQLREDFIKHIDYIETYAKNAEVYYDTMKLRYGSYVDKNGEPVFKDEHFEKLMLLSGSIDDASLRLKSLIEDIRKSELSSDPKSMQIFTNLIKVYEKMKIKEVIPFGEGKSVVIDAEKGLGKLTTQQTKELFKRITDLSINPDKRDMLANKFADYLKLSIKKKQYLDQYESIVSNPEINADTIKETIAAPSTSTDELRDTIDLIHGNSRTVDGKIVPSTVELGTEYYVQSKPIVGMYGDKMGTVRDFVKFKILGEKDGKLTVSYEKDGTTYTTEVPKDYFKDKKIAKVSDVEKNAPAKFAIEHAGDIFVYKNSKVKLNGEEETVGDIFFDPTDRQLKFRYRGKDGKIKLQDIDIKDFDEKVSADSSGKRIVTPAKIQFKDKVKRLSAEELDAIRKYKESEADRMQREKLIKGKLAIITELVQKKKEALKGIEDSILDYEIDIEQKKNEITSLLEKIESYPLRENKGQLTKDAKKWLETSIGTVRELSSIVNKIEAKKQELESQQEDLQNEIDYLNDISIEDLPSGRALLTFLDKNKKNIESIILETGDKINKLTDFINKTGKAIKEFVNMFADYVDKFAKKYTDIDVDTNNLRNFASSVEEYMDQVASIVGNSSPIIEDMQQMKSAISEMEELDVPVRQSEVRAAEKEIDNLYEDLKALGREFKLTSELYDTFNTAVKEFEKEQARIALFESPEARAAISAEQRLINQRNNKTNPVNDPEEVIRLANEKKLPSKSIETVFLSSITPSYEDRPEGGWRGPSAEHDGWVDRWNEFTANNNLGFASTEKKEGTRYVTDDPDYRANMKVIVVTRNNQQHYFAPESAFIKPGYEFGPKSVDNKTDAKDATIAYVHVYVANDGLWFVGKNGELLSKVGTKDADPNRVVFTRMETADLQRASGFNKYHADGFTPEQIIEIQKKALEERGKILAHEGKSGVYDYAESRGIANEEKFTEGEKTGKTKSLGTSVVDAKLVPESAIGTGVIVIPTLSSNAEKPGFVVAGDNAVPMTVGYPVLVYNNNVAYLSGKKFSGKEVDHLYSVIKAMAENYLKTGKISKQFTDYLSSVLYFRDSYGGEAGNNQFGFDNQGNLVFGINKKPVKFLAEEIEANKVLIKEFLSNANHNVSNRALEEKGFNEITSIDKEGEPVLRTWNSYEEYLLSAKNNEGKGKRDGDIPLTVNIKQSEQAWQTPFKNKYIRPLFGEDYFDQIVPEREVKQPEPKPTEPSAEIEFDKPTQYTDADGNKFTYTPRKLGNMTIVEISSAVDKDGNRLNQDLIDDKTVEIRDVITKPVEKKPEETEPTAGTEEGTGLSNVKSFKTAKESVYTVLPDGRTQRFKTATGEQSAPQDLIVFVKFESLEQQQDFLAAVQDKTGNTKVYVIDNEGNKYNTNHSVKGKDVRLVIADKDGNVINIAEISTEPVIGYNTFDQRRFTENGESYRQAHIGNKVTEIEYKNEEPISSTTAEPVSDIDAQRQKALEDNVQNIKEQIKALRGEDGTVSAENMSKFNELVKELKEAEKEALRADNTKGFYAIKKRGDVANKANTDPEILAGEDVVEAEELIEEAIKNSKSPEEAIKNLEKLQRITGIEFDITTKNEIIRYLKDRFSNAPKVGNNKESFPAWRRGTTDAELAALGKEKEAGTKQPEIIAEEFTKEDARSTPADVVDNYDGEEDWKGMIDGTIKVENMNGGWELMEKVSGEEFQEVGDRQAEKEFIESVIPQIKYEELPDFIRTGNGTAAYGMYKNYYIALYKDAPIGTGYHETWHAVEHSFLDNKTLNKLRSEFFDRKGTFTDRFGREIAYSKPEGVETKYDSKEKREYFEQDGKKLFIANEYDRRERLAEEFRQFKANNPAYKKPSFATNIFKRILNFIEHFVFGKPETIQGVFKKINAGYYRHSRFVKRAAEGPEYSAMKGIPEQTKAYVLQGVAWKMIDNLKRSHGDLMKVAEGITVYDMFEPVYKQLEGYYEDKTSLGSIWGRAAVAIKQIKEKGLPANLEKAELDLIKEQTLEARKVWEYIKANKAAVNQDLKDYFRKHKVIFTKDKNVALREMEESEVKNHDSETIGIEYYDDNKDRGYDRDIFKIDMKDSAPIEIKLLFSFLTQTEGKNPNGSKVFGEELLKPQQKLSPVLLPMAVDTSKYIYRVLDEMEGITDPAIIKRKLNEMAIEDPVLYALYAPIYKNPETLNDWRLQISFNKFAAKVKPVYLAWRIDETGRSYIMNSNIDSDARLLISQWETSMRGDDTGLTVVDKESGVFTLNVDKIKNVPSSKEESVIAFLKELNFPIDKKAVAKLSKGDKASLIAETANFYAILKKGEKFKPISYKSIKATSLGRIVELLSKTGVIKNPSSHSNVNGDKVQNHVMFNRLNRAMSSIIEAGTINNLKKLNPRLFTDTWSKDSILIKAGGPLFDNDGYLRKEVKDGTDFKMIVAEGLINDKDYKNKATSTDKMNKAVRFMNMLNMNLGQRDTMIFFNFIPADSTTETGVRMSPYIGRKEFRDGTYKKEFNETATGYLKSEIELIKENILGLRTITENARKGDAYKNLQTFKDILVDKDGMPNQELVKKITDYAQGLGADKDKTTDDFLKSVKSEVEQALDNFFENNTKEKMEFLENYRLLQKQVDGKYKFYGVNIDFVESMDYGKDGLFTEKEIKDILKYRHLNLFMHNTEMRKLFYGPWYEVPDAVKRDKLSMSGSEKTYAGDVEFSTWARQNLNKVGDVNLVNGEFGYHSYNDNFNVFTYDHDKGISSFYYDQIEEVIGKEKAAPYLNVEESDGQAIVLDTHWKDYVLRSGDFWNDDYEKQHQFDLASARKEYYSRKGNVGYRKELMDADQAILDAGDPMVYGVGNPKKPIGAGMLNNDSQAIPYAFKTSIMRLSYTVAKERGLENLYWWMHDNNIGMTGPKSFQKYGRLYSEELKGLPELYKMDKDGKPYVALKDITKEQMSQLTLNVDWSDFNKIVEIPKGKTGKTMGSQLRSLVLLNSFHYGLPVDFYKEGDNYAKKWEEWNRNNMTEDQRKKSSDRYRMFKDNDDAISEIAKRGYDKAMSTLGMTEKDGEYEFTNVNKVVDYLRSEITRRDLPDNVADGLTWEIDDAGYERLKYPLEVLPNYQALKSMIWSVVDKNVIRPKLNGTDLVLVSGAMWEKGVRVTVDKNGKKFLSSSELKFYQRGKNGAKTSLMEVYAPNIFREKLMKWKESNPDKATMSDEQLLDYLNETEEGKKLLSMIGFRIPTQGMNSVDAVKIAGFLHPSMGDSIVVPSEMVTKAGADFDIDKMGTYYYNFYVNKEGIPKLVEFLDDSNSTAEERYVKYINDHSKNKGDIDALKASSEYKEMDNMYERTKESAKNLYERGVSEKADYRKQIEDFKEANNDQYARGKEFFRQLPLQYKEWFWDMEQDFQSQQIKGVTKIQEYHAFTNDLIESIKLDIATDKAKEQDRAALPYLEAMAEVSKVTLENYDISEQHIADYKKFRDDIKENVKKGQVSLFDSLIANQKKYFKQWLLEASKIVAEARGIESFEDFSTKNFYEQNSREAVENKYYETLQDIVTYHDNYEQIVTPNSSKEMTDIESKISELQMSKRQFDKKKGRSKNDVNYSNLLDPIFLSNERHDFIEAKGTLVGIGAQNNTFHALAQTQPIFVENFEKLSNFNREYFSYKTGEKDPATGKEIMDYDYNIYLAHNKLNVDGVMKTTYSGTRDTVGSFISDKISQYINGAVDAVKDTWLIRLIKNKDLMGTAIFLDRIGVSAEHVFTFINQPIIQEYIKEQGIRKSVKGINTDIYDRFKNDTISDIMKLTYASDSEKFAPTKVDFNLKDMYKMIELAGRDGKKLNELPAEYREMQRQILHEFIKYELMGKDSLTDQMAIMWGNISGINDAVIKDKNATIDLAQKTSVINASSSILANTFQGKIKNSADKIANAIEKILKVSASPALDHIEKHILNKAVFMKGDDRAEVLERATFSLIDFATQTKTKVAGQYLNARIAELLLDPTKNTAKLLKQMRNDPSIKGQLKELLNNPILLGKLQPSIGKDVKTQRNIKIQDKPNDSLDANMFTEALRQLRDNEITNGLYKRIVLTGILQSGVRDGKVSFNKFIPYEDYMKELMPAVDAILNMDISKFEDTMAFYRANYNDPRIVPELTKIEGEFGSYVPYYTENNILSNYLPERLKSQGETLQAPKFVIVSKKADLQHPVLKVKIRGVDPETGLEYTSGDASEMASGGDYSFITTRIFQKVMDEMGNPLSVGKDFNGNEKYLYKQINAWGNNLEMQEYYDTKRPSTLAMHEKVYELEDWQIMLAIRETRFVEAPKEENVSTTATEPVVQKGTPTEEGKKPTGKLTPMEGLNERLDNLGFTRLIIPSNYYEGGRPEGRLNAFKEMVNQVSDNLQVLVDQNYSEFSFLPKDVLNKLESLKPLTKEFSDLNMKLSDRDLRTDIIEKRYAELSKEILEKYTEAIGPYVKEQLGKNISTKSKVSDAKKPNSEPGDQPKKACA